MILSSHKASLSLHIHSFGDWKGMKGAASLGIHRALWLWVPRHSSNFSLSLILASFQRRLLAPNNKVAVGRSISSTHFLEQDLICYNFYNPSISYTFITFSPRTTYCCRCHLTSKKMDVMITSQSCVCLIYYEISFCNSPLTVRKAFATPF